MLIFDKNNVVESAIRRGLLDTRIDQNRIDAIILTLQIADLNVKLARLESGIKVPEVEKTA